MATNDPGAELDHLVIGGSDLGLLVAWWKQLSGTDAARGGSHDGFGTRNALIGVDSTTYVELIANDPGQPEPQAPRPFGLDELPADSVQLLTFVLAVPDIEVAAAALRDVGLDPGPVRAMSRRRSDGEELHWQLAIPPDSMGGTQPALIQWGEGTPHPGSQLEAAVSVDELAIGHPEPSPLRTAFGTLGFAVDVEETLSPSFAAHFTSAGGADFWL